MRCLFSRKVGNTILDVVDRMYMLKEISRVSPWILAPNAKAESLLYGPQYTLGAINFNLDLRKMDDPCT